MPSYVPIVTPLGTLRGRDAIFLDAVVISDDCNTVTLSGEFNCTLASKPRRAKWQAYSIRFCGVVAFQMIELDTWGSLQQRRWPETAFDELTGSPWLAQMRGKASSNHRHFVVRTYDQVFELISTAYQLKLKGTRA